MLNHPNNGPDKIPLQTNRISQKNPEEQEKARLAKLHHLPGIIKQQIADTASPALKKLEDIVESRVFGKENTNLLDTITSDLQTRLSMLSGATDELSTASSDTLDIAKNDLEEEFVKFGNSMKTYLPEIHRIIKKFEDWIEDAPMRLALHDDIEKEILNLKVIAESFTSFTQTGRKYQMMLETL